MTSPRSRLDPLRRARAALLLLALASLLHLLPPTAIAASLPPSARLAPAAQATGTAGQDFAADRNQATADFPDGITFALEATAPFPVERVELLYRPVGVETLRLALPDLPPPAAAAAAVTIELRVDLADGDIPPGIDLAYRWRLLGADGAAVETAEAVVPWHDDRFDWQTYAGERATLHATGGADAFNRDVLATTEEEIVRLESWYGAALAAPVQVWLYASMEDLAGALRPNTETWVAGAAYPALGLILAVIAPGDAAEVGRVIPHEVSHLVLDRATGNPFAEPPTWLDEGLAVLQERGDQAPYLALARRGLLDGETAPLPALAGGFPYDPEGAQLAYAQSLSVVEYVVDRYGDEGMARLIAAFRQPVTVDAAVRGSLGVSLAELEAGWSTALTDETGPFADASRGAPTPWESLLAASGGLMMGIAALLAVAAGITVLRRSRRHRWDDDPEPESTASAP